MNKKILLIGGAGYIGTVLIRHFLDKKYHVTCLDNLIYNHSNSLSEFEKNNKFNFENDPFKKMFENQILLKNRHTINFNKFRTKSKKINDYFN